MKCTAVLAGVVACAFGVIAASDGREASARDSHSTIHDRAFRRAQASEPQDRANLQGLDPPGVKERIGPPDEIDEHGESDETYWIYNTKEGTLTVHFQNGYVIAIYPRDFPVAKILK